MTVTKQPKYLLGGMPFPTKAAITNHCKKILYGGKTTLQPLSPRTRSPQKVGPQHVPFLTDLLDRHPNADEKRGAGIDHFQIRDVTRGGSSYITKVVHRNFWLVRVDDTLDVFSYITCIKGKPASPEQEFAKAARSAIRASIAAYRNWRFRGRDSMPSDISGISVTPHACHVDHDAPTFQKIVEMYQAWRPDWKDIPICRIKQQSNTVHDLTREFADPLDAIDFREFHDDRAKLRIVTATENLTRKR